MTSSFILTLDVGEDTDLIGIAEDIKNVIDGQGSFIVVECKPFPHPTLYPTAPPGAPSGPNLLGGT